MKNNTNRKEIWSFGLYKESLRRLKIPAVIFFVIIAAAAILVPITMAVNYSNDSIITMSFFLSAPEVNPLLISTVYLAAPILTYTVFSFLNKRNASDLYSSMPHTRLAQFTSRIAAVATVLVGIIAVATAISVIMLLTVNTGHTIAWSSFVPHTSRCLIGSLLACAVMALAMSVTGTVLNNLLVAALIAFLPRIFLFCSAYAVIGKFPLAASFSIPHFFSRNINLLTGFYSFLSLTGDNSLSLYSFIPHVYSFCLALVYLAIGAFLFCRRKSESAERAAPTKRMQSIYRIILTMAVCLPVCFKMFGSGIDDSSDLIFCFWFYIAALITYFAYELITTKKWNNLIKSLPTLLAVVLLNVLLIGGLELAYRAEMSFCPDPDEISYVRFLSETSSYDMYSYGMNRTAEIEFKDSEMIGIVSGALERNLEYLNSTESDHIPHLQKKPDGSYVMHENRIVKIKAGLSEKVRYISFTEDEIKRIEEIMNSNEDCRKAWLVLPEAAKGSVTIDLGTKEAGPNVRGEILEVLREEVSTLDLKVWKEYLADASDEFAEIQYISGDEHLSIYISPSVLPKTTAAIVNARNANSYVSVEEVLKSIDEGTYIRNNIFNILSVSLYLPDGGFKELTTGSNSLKKNIDTDAELDTTKGFIMLKLILHHTDDPENYPFRAISYVCVPATEECLARYTSQN